MACQDMGGNPCNAPSPTCFCPTSGGGGTTTVNLSDPNYWAGWNNTIGSLGGAVGQWVDAFGNTPQQNYYQGGYPYQQQNNTMLYIGMGLLFLMILAVIYFVSKK